MHKPWAVLLPQVSLRGLLAIAAYYDLGFDQCAKYTTVGWLEHAVYGPDLGALLPLQNINRRSCITVG